MRRWFALAVCLSPLLSAPASAVGLMLSPPVQVNVYKNRPLRGADVYYLLAFYTVSNDGHAREYNSVRWSMVTSAGQQLSESLHPTILGFYCRSHGGCDQNLEQVPQEDILPGATIKTVAIMGPLTTLPEQMRLTGRINLNTMWINVDCKLDRAAGTSPIYSCGEPPTNGRKK